MRGLKFSTVIFGSSFAKLNQGSWKESGFESLQSLLKKRIRFMACFDEILAVPHRLAVQAVRFPPRARGRGPMHWKYCPGLKGAPWCQHSRDQCV